MSLWTKRWLLAIAVGLLAAPVFGQTAAELQSGTQSPGAYIGFKSAEDKGLGLETWLRLDTVFPGAAANVSPLSHPEAWSATGRYIDGAFTWSADYARQQDNLLNNYGDQAWRLASAYHLSDEITLGMLYGRGYAPAAALSPDNSGWGLMGIWHIETAQTLRAGYLRTSETFTAPVSLASVNAQLAGGGADMWQLLYEYAFSQLTTLDVRYANSDNEVGGFYLNPGEAAAPDFGLEERSLDIRVKHRF